jgi:hypothetical protein
MRLLVLFLLFSAPAFAQSDTIMVMVRPAYTEYVEPQIYIHGRTEQYLIQEASFEGAVFDSIPIVIVLREAFWTDQYIRPQWNKIQKKCILKSKNKEISEQTVSYEYNELLSSARFDSLFVPAVTIIRQRRIVKIQGNSEREVPPYYNTIVKYPQYPYPSDYYQKIQHPAEYKIFPIK